MSNGEFIRIEPQEVQLPFELRKQISCSLQLTNNTDNYVAFKVKTTNPKKYCVRPNTGIVLPNSSSEVIVTMQAVKEAPTDMQCKDKFLIQCVVASYLVTTKDITAEMFNKESGNRIEEYKLRVVFVTPHRYPSPVREEGSEEEGSSPRASLSENGTLHHLENTVNLQVSKEQLDESQEHSSELKTLISKVTAEKNSAIQQTNKLHQELELLRRESSKNHRGLPILHVVLIGLIGLILGYFLKTTT